MKYVTPSLIELLYKRSTERLATNRDFAYIREDIEQFRKQQGDKTISLNEKQRLAEKEEADARHKAREAERLARNNPAPKTYELALRPVDAPGLVEETNSVTAASAGVASVALAVGANSASVKARSEPSQAVPPDSSDVDENQRAETARLAETERILADYISLLVEKGTLTATSKPGRN
jgi:carboxyl-terminal processing protease